MRFWLKQVIYDYFKQKWFLLLFLTVFFGVGLFFGATAAKIISIDQADHLSGYLNSFLEKVGSTPIGEQVYFKQNLLNNLYILLAMYILGLTVIGIPLVLVAIFSKGFVLGFTIGFLVREKAYKGFAFALVSVMPHNLLIIPVIIVGGVTALSFSALLIKRRFAVSKIPLSGHFGLYTAIMFILGLVTTGAGFVETYVTPVLIKTAANWIK